MKRSGFFIFVLATQLIFAQATRFIYQVNMKSDSTDRSSSKTELANLDISHSTSIFYAENRLKRDSIMSRMRQTRSFDRDAMQSLRTNMDYVIEKDYKSGKKLYKARILLDEYIYEEDRPMIWKILPETATIGAYKTQKAETNFGGRIWHAWFTTEIPFQDGPYKFSGLPGLIVKVEDSRGDYSFDLKEIKKINEVATFDQRGTPISVKRAVFEKKQQQFQNDPLPNLTRGGMTIRIQMDPNQRKQLEERRKKEALKNNNPIELQ